MSSLLRSICFVFIIGIQYLPVQAQTTPEGNRQCLTCHTAQTFTIYNDWTELEEKRLMNPYYILDTVQLKIGAHKNFKCIDCHSMDYETYPHDGELKLEPFNTCIDCHGGDEKYASFQFEKIEQEFQKSIHFETSGDQFTCSKCHSQHYYKVTARESNTIKEIVDYSNKMCISCHGNISKYQLVSDNEQPQLIQAHNWLPNQELHFEHVRCIECHAIGVDSLNVAHNIQNRENAVKLCIECHSENSMLQASLYKYQNLQTRSENGSINTVIANESFVIGAYQNRLLNILSLLIFVATLGGISIHTILRILKK